MLAATVGGTPWDVSFSLLELYYLVETVIWASNYNQIHHSQLYRLRWQVRPSLTTGLGTETCVMCWLHFQNCSGFLKFLESLCAVLTNRISWQEELTALGFWPRRPSHMESGAEEKQQYVANVRNAQGIMGRHEIGTKQLISAQHHETWQDSDPQEPLIFLGTCYNGKIKTEQQTKPPSNNCSNTKFNPTSTFFRISKPFRSENCNFLLRKHLESLTSQWPKLQGSSVQKALTSSLPTPKLGFCKCLFTGLFPILWS